MTTDLVVRDDSLHPEVIGTAYNLAERIAQTEFVPTSLRGRPEAVMASILSGRELGIGPMQSLAKIHVIEGRPAMSSELMRAIVMSHGHEIWISEKSSTRVTVCGRRKGSEHTSQVTWTMDDAQRAGLNGKQNWRKYPRAMLTARATAELCRDLFADCLGGISYAIEEVQDGGFDDAPVEASVPSGEAEVKEPSQTVRRQSPQGQRRAEPVGRPPLPQERQTADAVPDNVDDDVVDAEVVEPGGDEQHADSPPPPPPADPPNGDRAAAPGPASTDDRPVSQAMWAKLHTLMAGHGIDEEHRRAFYRARYGTSSGKDLGFERVSRLIDFLQGAHLADGATPGPGVREQAKANAALFLKIADAQLVKEVDEARAADEEDEPAAEQSYEQPDWREVAKELGLHGRTVTAMARRVAAALGLEVDLQKLDDVYQVDHPEWGPRLHYALVVEAENQDPGSSETSSDDGGE